ncbi:hypothetical protein ABPG75_009032 [Micractinium tetrahymenae]
MAHGSSSQHKERPSAPSGVRKGVVKPQPLRRTLLPGELHATLQSRQLANQLGLRPPALPGAAQSARGAPPSGAARASSSSTSGSGVPDGPRSAPAAAGRPAAPCPQRTYVPVRTLPLIFAQRKRHLQQHKAKAQHTEPYQQRGGEGLLALPEDVLLKVVCLLSHDELRPLFQVCKALRDTLRNAVKYHFNFSTPGRRVEEAAPPALGERKERRPPRSNVYQVMSRLSRGPRAAAAGRGSGGSSRSTAPRALDFDAGGPAVASRA